MGFEDITGGFVIGADEENWEAVKNYILDDFDDESPAVGRIVDFAIAVGLAEKASEDPPPSSELHETNAGSVDQERILKTLIEQRHPEASPDRLKDLMSEYFEGGLRILADELDEQGYIRLDDRLSVNRTESE